MMNIKEEYYLWLCSLVDVVQEGCSYWDVTRAMYNRPFYWSVRNDDNRVYDGRALRDKFGEEMDISFHYKDFNEEVSVLEVIIGMAYRCEFIMLDQGHGDMIDWFWDMMDNSGLSKFDDDNYDGHKVELIMNKIVERTYRRDGSGGGLFPMKNPKHDMREVELWYQMNEYLGEKYYS